jgi:fibro-slime domain-containing protein
MSPSRLLLGVAVLAFAACEGRTAMRISPCHGEGQTQPCSNSCGPGVQTCQGGSWSSCVVPPTRLACSNTCGDGTQLCENNQIKEACQVAPVRFPCTNTCGTGTRLCQDNQLASLCEVAPVVVECSTICGTGTQVCADDTQRACTAPQPKQPKLTAVLRDFHNTFPDMNHDGIYETGIVESVLGDDDKPVYAHSGPTSTVVGRETFDQWFRDVDGVNTSMTLDIPLTPSSTNKDVYTYRNTSFFPLDGKLFGDEGLEHNYSFTAEIVTRFRYSGGESFTFSGDDDVFVFINRILAIDIGGIHESISKTVDLDAQADALGIRKGDIYSMHIFFAERHPIGSDFVVQTTISEFAVCD